MRYAVGRFVQLAGLLILPVAIATELAGKVSLGQSMLLALAGFAIFTIGRAIQVGGPPTAA